MRAGDTFWEPGGDVIHYQDGNNRDDIKVRFLVTMLCAPGQPMLTLVDDEELVARQDRRAPAEAAQSLRNHIRRWGLNERHQSFARSCGSHSFGAVRPVSRHSDCIRGPVPRRRCSRAARLSHPASVRPPIMRRPRSPRRP